MPARKLLHNLNPDDAKYPYGVYDDSILSKIIQKLKKFKMIKVVKVCVFYLIFAQFTR